MPQALICDRCGGSAPAGSHATGIRIRFRDGVLLAGPWMLCRRCRVLAERLMDQSIVHGLLDAIFDFAEECKPPGPYTKGNSPLGTVARGTRPPVGPR